MGCPFEIKRIIGALRGSFHQLIEAQLRRHLVGVLVAAVLAEEDAQCDFLPFVQLSLG
jgi:hypothetical protein